MTGSIVYANNSGLGTLAREFYDNNILDKVLVTTNNRYRDFYERFSGGRVYSKENLEWLLEGLDTLIFFETPFDDEIIPMAKKRGIKTILMPMYECTRFEAYNPDLWLAVSNLDEQWLKERDLKYVRINVPVNTKRVKWKLRETAQHFIHNAGHGGVGGRNGTQELIEAMKSVYSPIRLTINSQANDFDIKDDRITFKRANYLNYWDMWHEGDVFIFPERFNGLSLPIQEAFASGMMIMCTNREPFNEWLPTDPMIDPIGHNIVRIANEVRAAIISPENIAKSIDLWADRSIKEFSLLGKEWAKENSWEKLGPKYKEICTKH